MAIVPFDRHVPSLNGGDRADIRLVAIKANPRANTQLFGLFVCHFFILLSIPAGKNKAARPFAKCDATLRIRKLAEILTEGDICPISSLGRSGPERPICVGIGPGPDAANHAVARGLCGAAIPERLLCIAA
jgi:hypothetical protein